MTDTPRRHFVPIPAGRTGLYVLAGSLSLVLVVIVWLGFAYLVPPKLIYEIDSSRLVIRTSVGLKENAKVVELGRIYEAQPTVLRGGQLRMGREKPGYCVGLFYFGSVGEAYLATNCSDRAVVLKASGEVAPIVVTPPDGNEFIRALYAARPARFEAPSNMRGAGLVVAVLLLVLVLVVAGLVAALWLAPHRLSYEVGNGQLVVNTLMKRHVFSVPGTRVKVHRPLLGDRLSGVHLPGYWVGSYTLDTMATTVYASIKDEGVLVEADGRLFLTPQDKQGFLAALEEAGATQVSGAMQRRR
jgi:hypothetical protein